jgi:uncharacterized protein
MTQVKTPCLGICSTSSLGDAVCRGCKRYSFEVIHWNSYDAQAKSAVLKRIEKLNIQILENKLRIFSLPNLKSGLEQFQIPFDESLSPYCWLHNLLKKGHQRIDKLEEYGVYALAEYAGLSLRDLSELIDREILVLCEAHHARYFTLDRGGENAADTLSNRLSDEMSDSDDVLENAS